MIKQTQLKQYPEFSKKLVSNPIQNGWIFGIIAWIIMAIIIVVIANFISDVHVDILWFSIIVPILAYKTDKKNLSKYQNPPKLDNIYKFYLHLGISMGVLSILANILIWFSILYTA